MGNFERNTRMKRVALPTLTKPTGGGSVSMNLPKTGLLAGLYLVIRGTVAGTLSNLNALGLASIVKRVRVTSNSSIDIVNISGAGYHYMLQEGLETEVYLPSGYCNGRSAVSATTAILDMYLPIAINRRDPIGLLMLQNEQTLLTLTVEFETDTTVATGATVSMTVEPYMEYFTVPAKQEDLPDFRAIHQILEENQTVSGSGDVTYYMPRGNTILQLYHGLGIGSAGADGFSRFRTRVNQSDFWDDSSANFLTMEHYALRGRSRPAGLIMKDFLATSGLGNYGLQRDLFNSAEVTDYASVITATGAGTLYTIRRQITPLR